MIGIKDYRFQPTCVDITIRDYQDYHTLMNCGYNSKKISETKPLFYHFHHTMQLCSISGFVGAFAGPTQRLRRIFNMRGLKQLRTQRVGGGAGKARFNVATPTNATVTCSAYNYRIIFKQIHLTLFQEGFNVEHGRHLGGRQGDMSPSRFEGWGTQYQLSPPPRFLNMCVCPPKVLYPYKFRLERGLKLCIFSSPNTKFS